MKNINVLLEKYWEGETTLEEERWLREYFGGETVEQEHEVFRDLFLLQESESEMALGDDFDAAVLEAIGEGGGVRPPIAAKVVSLRGRSWMKWGRMVAAVLMIGMGIFWIIQKNQSIQNQEAAFLIVNGEKYYPASEEEAYELTKQALLLVSSKMKESKKGIDEMRKLERMNVGKIN